MSQTENLKLSIRSLNFPVEMQIFVKNLNGATSSVEIDMTTSVSALRAEMAAASGVSAESLRIVFAGKSLSDELTVAGCGICEESTLYSHMAMDGGAKKRKKKVYTKPKKQKHKHIKNKLAILKCYKVDSE